MRFISLLLLILLISVASAETLDLNDSAGSDSYVICQDIGNRPMFTWTGLRSITYVDGAQYDTFVCAEDDAIDRLDLIFASTGNYSIPVTFWYPDNTSMTLILEAEYTQWIPFPFWELNEFQYTLKDNSGYVLYEDSNINLFNNRLRILIEDGTLYLGDINSGTDFFDKALLHSINISVLPVQAITLDVSDIPSTSYDPAYCMVRVIDDETKTLKFDGWLYWVYTKIDFMDSDLVLYNVMYFIQIVWNVLAFVLELFVYSFWSYFALVNVFALFYAVLRSNFGYFAMLEGYMRGMYWGLYPIIALFRFLIGLIMSLLAVILPI